MSRRGIIRDDAKVVFFWSHKCACITLFNVLAQNFGGHVRDYWQATVDWPDCVEAIDRHGYRSVVVARDPWRRTVSSYLNKFITHKGQSLRRVGDLEGFSRRLLRVHHAQALGLHPAPPAGFASLPRRLRLRLRGHGLAANDLCFEDFLSTVATLHRQRADPDRNTINGHWDTQVPPALLRQGFRYDHVVHVEHFDSEFAQVATQLDLAYQPQQHNRTGNLRSTSNPGYIGDQPPHQLLASHIDVAGFVNPANAALVGELFATDYAAFGYPLP